MVELRNGVLNCLLPKYRFAAQSLYNWLPEILLRFEVVP
jgi:hypothetical protein